MSNLFIEIRRPLAEQKIIKEFINSYQKGESLYKSKDYQNALDLLRIALNYLNDIWDEYPKICTLYLIMKILFHIRKYGECLSIQEEILGKIKLERMRDLSDNKQKRENFIKIEAKIDVYNLLINFIFDNSSKSVECILNMIKFISEDNSMVLEEKIIYFWNYLKSFIQISGITKSHKFMQFKESFDSMIITNRKDDETTKKASSIYRSIYDPVKTINPSIIDNYKILMNNELKIQLYEILDKEYYLSNFGIENDKVINFLQKNMHIYIVEKNKKKLLQLFNTFVVLGKIDLKKKFNMTMNELIYAQKSRIEDWSVIYANLIGGFQHIFKKNFRHEKKIYSNKSLNNLKTIKLRPKTGISNIKTFRGVKSVLFNLNKQKEETKKEEPISSFDYFNIDNCNIKIPNNFEKIKKRSIFSDLINRNKTIKIKNKTFRKNKIIDFKLKIPKHSDLTFNKNILNYNNYLSNKISNKNNKIHFPNIINRTKSNKKNIKLNFSENSIFDKNKKSIINEKKVLNKVMEKLIKTNINNQNKDKENKNDLLRTANNVFMDILINIFTPIYKLENKLFSADEKINYKKIFPRKIDLNSQPQFRSLIKSYHYKWSQGLYLKENYNSFFYYENFLLVDNLIFMGICRNHGNKGKIITNKLSILFPCFLIYIIIEDNLKKEKRDINKEIYKLFKIEESSKDFKDMYLLKYFFYKFKIDFKKIPLLIGNNYLLKKQINEAFYSSHNEIKDRYRIIPDISSTTILSCFFLNKTINILHLGYFEMIVGKYNDNFHEWETKTIITQSELKEEKLKTIMNKKKNGNKKKKDISTSMSNTELEKSQNIEINFEENEEIELSKYNLEKNDKIIIIGSKGIYNNLTKEEIINEIGKYYFNDKSADEACSYLIELAKSKSNKNKKDNNLIYDYEKENKKFETEKEIFMGYYNDFTCIVIFLE